MSLAGEIERGGGGFPVSRPKWAIFDSCKTVLSQNTENTSLANATAVVPISTATDPTPTAVNPTSTAGDLTPTAVDPIATAGDLTSTAVNPMATLMNTASTAANPTSTATDPSATMRNPIATVAGLNSTATGPNTAARDWPRLIASPTTAPPVRTPGYGFTTETTNASGLRYFCATALTCSSVTASNFASSSSVRR